MVVLNQASVQIPKQNAKQWSISTYPFNKRLAPGREAKVHVCGLLFSCCPIKQTKKDFIKVTLCTTVVFKMHWR